MEVAEFLLEVDDVVIVFGYGWVRIHRVTFV